MSGYKYVPWADHEVQAINRPAYEVGQVIKYNPPFVDLKLHQEEYLLVTGIINTDIEPPYQYALLNLRTGEAHNYSIWYVNNMYAPLPEPSAGVEVPPPVEPRG